ncbi:MAG: M56 family metallopeptidase, partial [Planctomycetota bacterium]
VRHQDTNVRTVPTDGSSTKDSHSVSVVSNSFQLEGVVTTTWFIGSLLMLAYLGLGVIRSHRIIARSKAVSNDSVHSALDRIARSASIGRERLRVRCSADIDSPVVIGLGRPCILIPDRSDWNQTLVDIDNAESILRHEVAHIQRRDPFWNFLLQVVTALWWANPLIWWMQRQIHVNRELICDAQAMQNSSPEEYASLLLQLARRALTTRPRLSSIAIRPPRRTLECRVRWILSNPSRDQIMPFASRRQKWVVIAIVLLVSITAFLRLDETQLLGQEQVGARAGESTEEDEPTEKTPSTYSFGDRVEGVLVGRDLKPVVGADVFLWKVPPGSSVSLPIRPQRTLSDVNGHFVFADVTKANYRVWAETDDASSLRRKLGGINVRGGQFLPERQPQMEIQLRNACGYDVQITDALTGKPIDNAKVSFGWTDIERDYRSGPDGRCKIRNLAPAEWYFIVTAKDYGTEFVKTMTQEPGTVSPIQIKLPPGRIISGRVVGSDGKGIAGVRVSASPGIRSVTPGYDRSETDAEGRFRLSGIPTDSQVRLSTDSDDPDLEYVSQTIGVTADHPDEPIELICEQRPRFGNAIIHVVDEKGNSIAGAIVENMGRSSQRVRRGITDPNGRVRLDDVYGGAGLRAVVTADGFVSSSTTFQAAMNDNPPVTRAVLTKGRTVSGTIVFPSGKPAASLRVYYDRGEYVGQGGGMVKSDANGRFEIDGMKTEGVISVYTPRGYQPIRGMQIPADQDEVDVTLSPSASLRIVAIDAESREPIPAFNVRLNHCQDRKPGDPPTGGISSSYVNPGYDAKPPKSLFELENLAAGVPYKVIVSAEGYETTHLARVVSAVGDDRAPVKAELVMRSANDYEAVTGTVVDARGKPVPAASVVLINGASKPGALDPFTGKPAKTGWSRYAMDAITRDQIRSQTDCIEDLRTTTDAAGRFRFDQVKKDTPWTEVLVIGEQIVPWRSGNLRRIDASPISPLDIQLERGATITVHIDPALLSEAYSVNLQPGTGPFPTAQRSALSQRSQRVRASPITFENIPSGEVKISVMAFPKKDEKYGFMSMKTHSSKVVMVEEGKDLRVSF